MITPLGTDPGAWNIVGWILTVLIVGAAVLWAVTTLILRSPSRDAQSEEETIRP